MFKGVGEGRVNLRERERDRERKREREKERERINKENWRKCVIKKEGKKGKRDPRT